MLAFYADESGSFDPHDPGQPWVVLLAIGFDDDHWLTIHRAFTNLKLAYFPGRAPGDIEIRSNDLRTALARPRAENPFSSLGVSSLRRFGEDLYGMVDALPFAWCGVAIHKAFAREHLKVRDGRALFSLAYRTTVERLHGWCVEAGRVGRFFIDQRERNLEGRVHRDIGKLHEEFSDWTGHAARTTCSSRTSSLTTCCGDFARATRRIRISSASCRNCGLRAAWSYTGPKSPRNDVPG